MISILLVEDHAVVRNGYRRLLDAEDGMRVVGEAASADEAYARLCAGGVDLAVVDLNLRGSSGIDAIRRMIAREPGLRVLVISMHDNPSFVTQAMRVGALGYLTKNSEPAEMIEAIREVAAGRRVLAADVAQALAGAALDGEALLSRLTPREFDVLRLAASGESPGSIASTMHLSQKTIHNHLSAIRQKLDADNDFKLLRLAARYGLIDWSALPA
ncbi:response regulator [Zoogloea dura]|jgi:two-component system invasion response regulator UvrY|uniref:Response regulator transcription factor n=1 Tax=Zoogloea dura TaxID=2728840 RepID=A0A848G981_9RHOO|nr:response regulator transcription factor [Zoogloea dura]NML27890.1 response regulator transcription factor [Zoogloea dura]